MNIKKIIEFCNTFKIDLDDLEFYPGHKREILMCLPEEDFERIYPRESTELDDAQLETLLDEFQEKWWYVTTEFGTPAFNVFY